MSIGGTWAIFMRGKVKLYFLLIYRILKDTSRLNIPNKYILQNIKGAVASSRFPPIYPYGSINLF